MAAPAKPPVSREGARELYNKVQTDSLVPQLEKDLKEARLKWVDLAKECAFWTADVRKVQKLEVDVAELQKTITELCNIHQAKIERLRNIHQAEIERKDAFCELEKVRAGSRVLTELQASYNAKLPCLYAEQYECGSWVGYDEVERIARGDLEPSSKDAA